MMDTRYAHLHTSQGNSKQFLHLEIDYAFHLRCKESLAIRKVPKVPKLQIQRSS